MNGDDLTNVMVSNPEILDAVVQTSRQVYLLAKDVGIAADLMRSVNLDAPLAAQVNERYKTALSRLGTARDNSEAILAWDNNNQES